jgi:hypothetical protein
MPWLEAAGIQVIRQRVEDLDLSMFDKLRENDILFIDSSHIIRPQGDVLREYLQIIPRLATGVIVHVHDIFTPRDYTAYFYNVPRLWNEQYLLEAFLACNKSWEVLLAANMLKHEYFDLMKIEVHLAHRRSRTRLFLYASGLKVAAPAGYDPQRRDYSAAEGKGCV